LSAVFHIGGRTPSQIEFDCLRRLIDEDLVPGDVTIQVLVQARRELIERTFESLRGAKRRSCNLSPVGINPGADGILSAGQVLGGAQPPLRAPAPPR
jgi:hypothetical protein